MLWSDQWTPKKSSKSYVQKEVQWHQSYYCLNSMYKKAKGAPSESVFLDAALVHLIKIVLPRPEKSTGDDRSIAVDYFTFSSSIAESLRSASLVISHAGSGSIFETLRLRKPLIVVVNGDLMDNHQVELAEELAERKHLFCARTQTLYQTLASMDLDSLLPYPSGDAKPVANLINKFLGFPED